MDTTKSQLLEVAARIREMREILGFSQNTMAQRTDLSLAEYKAYESGETDLPFSFIHKCALAFNIDITDLLEGHSTRLTSYTVTRRGHGQQTAKEMGIDIQNLAPKFKNKIAEPYWVKYDYSEELQSRFSLPPMPDRSSTSSSADRFWCRSVPTRKCCMKATVSTTTHPHPTE